MKDVLTKTPVTIISDPRILDAEKPARHWATVRYADRTEVIVELWTIDGSAQSVFGLLERWRSELGAFEFAGLQKVPVEAA